MLTCLLILERGEDMERNTDVREKHRPDGVGVGGGQACNLGMCPDQELNL